MPTSDVLKSPLRRDDRCSAVADKLTRIPKANSQYYPGPTAFEPPTDSHLVVAVEYLENTPRVLPPCETADMPDEVRKRVFLGRNPAPNAYHHPELATQFLAMLPRRQATLAGPFANFSGVDEQVFGISPARRSSCAVAEASMSPPRGRLTIVGCFCPEAVKVTDACEAAVWKLAPVEAEAGVLAG
jgi:hypothetical protein